MAVTNATTYANVLTNGGAVAELLAAEVLQQLYDPTDIRATVTRIAYNPMGSDTLQVAQDRIPGAFTAPGENMTLAATAYTTSHFDIQVAAYRRAYALGDLVPVSGSPIDLDRAVNNLMQGVALTMTDLIAAVFPSFTTQAGTLLTPLDTDGIYDGIFALTSALNSGPASCVLSPTQFNDFISSLRAETGAAQWLAATGEMLAQRGPGFKGSWMNVDFYVSDSVGNDGAGSALGGLYTPGAIAYSMANVASMGVHVPAANIILNAGELLVELDRTASDGVSAAYATMFAGVSLAEDARGVEIISNA
jgi:hypothetical protein